MLYMHFAPQVYPCNIYMWTLCQSSWICHGCCPWVKSTLAWNDLILMACSKKLAVTRWRHHTTEIACWMKSNVIIVLFDSDRFPCPGAWAKLPFSSGYWTVSWALSVSPFSAPILLNTENASTSLVASKHWTAPFLSHFFFGSTHALCQSWIKRTCGLMTISYDQTTQRLTLARMSLHPIIFPWYSH